MFEQYITTRDQISAEVLELTDRVDANGVKLRITHQGTQTLFTFVMAIWDEYRSRFSEYTYQFSMLSLELLPLIDHMATDNGDKEFLCANSSDTNKIVVGADGERGARLSFCSFNYDDNQWSTTMTIYLEKVQVEQLRGVLSAIGAAWQAAEAARVRLTKTVAEWRTLYNYITLMREATLPNDLIQRIYDMRYGGHYQTSEVELLCTNQAEADFILRFEDEFERIVRRFTRQAQQLAA